MGITGTMSLRSVRASPPRRKPSFPTEPQVPARCRVCARYALSAWALAIASSDALSQTWRIEPSISAQSTLTDNVALTPVDRRSDWVNQITPSVTLT